MSKENVERFINQIAGSQELQARIGTGMDGEALATLGAENGCDFSVEELGGFGELSDQELDGVAGGFLRVGIEFEKASPKFRFKRNTSYNCKDSAGNISYDCQDLSGNQKQR